MVDFDDVFAYNTKLIVKIRHRWVGLAYKLAQLVIFLYIVVGQIIVQQTYYALEKPVGIVQLSLREPSTRSDSLSYCSSAAAPNPADHMGPLRCVQWDADLAGVLAGSALIVTTRVGLSDFTRNCSETVPTGSTIRLDANGTPLKCAEWRSNETMYNVADISEFTVMAVHGVHGVSTDFNGGTRLRPEGAAMKLYYADDNEDGTQAEISDEQKKTGVADAVKTTKHGDIMTVGKILEAARINLDDASPAVTGDSIRYAGINIVVYVTYSSNTGEAMYSYKPEVMPTSVRRLREHAVRFPYQRRAHELHGLQLVFVIDGELQRFDFKTLMLSLVSGFALISLATLLVDTLITYVMPRKDDYRLFKFEMTPDFSPDDDEEAKVLEDVLHKLRQERNALMGLGHGTAVENAAELFMEDDDM